MSSIVSTDSKSKSPVIRLYAQAAKLDRFGMGVLRLGLVVVLDRRPEIYRLRSRQHCAAGREQPADELPVLLSGSRVPALHE